MLSTKLSILFVCAVIANSFHVFEAKPHEPAQENAFDKIAKIDARYGEFTDARHEADMILPEIKKSRSRRGLGKLQIQYETVKLWPGGVIPYTLTQELRDKRGFYKTLMQAMNEWQGKTCITFKERTTEKHYVHIYNGHGCQSDVGTKERGKQTLSLGSSCDLRSIIIHELGHTIGLYHEQNRPDRDKNIKVLWDNIISAYHYAYEIKSGWHPESIKTDYDYYSIMHYGKIDFNSRVGAVTMKAYKKGISSFGGEIVTGLDAIKVRKMYKCKEFPQFPRDFYWSHHNYGISGKTCIKINEPRDYKNSWNNNKLCYISKGKRPLNIVWSHQGPIADMKCEKISYKGKSAETSWNDNYLCLPKYAPFKFKWINGRVPWQERRKNCLKINEPLDRQWSRSHHYLCATERETDKIDGKWLQWSKWDSCSFKCGTGFQFRERTCSPPANGGTSCVGESRESRTCNTQPCDELPSFPKDFKFVHTEPNEIPSSGICLRTYDMWTYFKWRDYFFCTSGAKINPGLMWSFMGPVRGMRCTHINNPKEPAGWKDNYLCVPKSSPYRFKWSLNGPIAELTCMRWYAQAGQRGWDKTYLCDENQKTIHAAL